MAAHRNLIFIIAAIICFIIALLLDADFVLHGSHWGAWMAGGSAAFAAAHLP